MPPLHIHMLHLAAFRIKESYRGLTFHPHELARIRQSAITHFAAVSGVIVAVTDQVVLSTLRHRSGNFRVMAHTDPNAAVVQLRKRSVQLDVRMAGRKPAHQPDVTLVVAPDHVHWFLIREPAEPIYDERRAKVAAVNDGVRTGGFFESGLELPDIVMRVGHDGDLHTVSFQEWARQVHRPM